MYYINLKLIRILMNLYKVEFYELIIFLKIAQCSDPMKLLGKSHDTKFKDN